VTGNRERQNLAQDRVRQGFGDFSPPDLLPQDRGDLNVEEAGGVKNGWD
jgi:hypothetical protein